MASPQRFSSSVRGLAATVLELFQVRLELLSVEAQEEVLRIGALLVYGAMAVTLLGLGLCFLAMLITVALWDSHRLLPLAVFAVLFLALGALAAYQARQRLLSQSRLFSASVDEIKRDLEALRP
ncbi:MAG: phage holin family protein [Hydrogenophaga sp.]|uniref:phage holin family protein n=1 Tax=Hydrogenophaga sp. TaxID=1904254 RepID=UPI0027524EF9|nr:phage holin family protein [Hydrogenophaga sp.]MDP2417742.1 phage holin family protein [Hydrogenophaga sp.]MDZ4188353.1 phage holin family protein [Hydrogenophaga sp.]